MAGGKGKAGELPEVFIERMQSLLGEEARRFLESLDERPVRGLRLNSLKGDLKALKAACRGQFTLEAVPWAEEGFYVIEAQGRDGGRGGTDVDVSRGPFHAIRAQERSGPGPDRRGDLGGPGEEARQGGLGGLGEEARQGDLGGPGEEARQGGPRRPGKHPYHEAGLYYLQEPSAMAAVVLLGPEPGDLVLDLCAAPGGKSTQIAGRLKGAGLLVSNEIHPARAKILSQNMERLGVSGAVVVSEAPETLAARFPAFFDKILVDAPCSGEGMFRKDPGARQEWSPEAAALCAARQKTILEAGLQMLKPGGRLVYSTCTFAPEEDEGSVADLLETHPGTKVEHRVVKGFADLGRGRPEWVEEGPGREGLEYTYRVWPHQVKGEGHYLAALKKAGESSASVGRPGWPGPGAGPLEDRRPPRAQAERAGGKGASAGKKAERQEIWQLFTAFCQETLSTRPWELQPGRYLTFGGQLYYVPSAMPDMDGLKVLRPGLHLGTFKKNRFEPAHALALYLRPEHVKRQADLPCLSQEAERYLRGEALMVGGAEDGWTLVTVDGYSLGWGKAAKGVLKNHYPKGLRLQGGL